MSRSLLWTCGLCWSAATPTSRARATVHELHIWLWRSTLPSPELLHHKNIAGLVECGWLPPTSCPRNWCEVVRFLDTFRLTCERLAVFRSHRPHVQILLLVTWLFTLNRIQWPLLSVKTRVLIWIMLVERVNWSEQINRVLRLSMLIGNLYTQFLIYLRHSPLFL